MPCMQQNHIKNTKKQAFCLLFYQNKQFEPVYKPSSVVYGHLSRLAVADKLERYSRFPSDGQPYMIETQSCNGWGLHGIPCYQDIGELLPRLSILTTQSVAVYFCCTILKVTFT